MNSVSLINLLLLNIYISYANCGLCVQTTVQPPITTTTTTKNIVKTTFFITIPIPCPKGTITGLDGGCFEMTTKLDNFEKKDI